MAGNAVGKQRGPGRPFPPGRSGNPQGKLPGTRNRASRAAEMLLDGEAEALTRKAVEMALAGDATALRLCLDRILPPRKGRPVGIDLPAVTSAAAATAALCAVIAAMGNGTLSPDEAAAVTAVVEVQRRAIETAEHEARLRALEERVGTDEQRI
jgi:Family of unknown function (DUF5681)